MPLAVIETDRELKNKITGIDLYVSDFQEIPHRLRKSTYLYHVIVITNLFYYKTKKHKEGDVVQFMVSKSFEEFKELYEQLYDRFPSVNFPALPAQSLISTDYKAQLECIDNVLKIVASTQKLCSSPMVIKFLKGQSITKKPSFDDAYIEDQNENKSQTTNEEIVEVENEQGLFASPSKELEIKEEEIDAISEDTVESSQENSLFAEEQSTVNKDSFVGHPAKLPEGNIDDEEDDFDDLLSVRKDVDDILSLIKTSNKQSLTKTSQQTAVHRQRTQSKTNTTESGEELFQKAKTASMKRSQANSKDLDEIFGAKSSNLFEPDVDNDLFTSNLSSYIEKENTNKLAELDLS